MRGVDSIGRANVQSKRTMKPTKRWSQWPSPAWRGVPHGLLIEGPEDFDFLRAKIGGLDLEVALTIGLDARMRLRFVRTVGLGTRSRCHVLPASVLRPVVQAGLSGAIVAHNHPKGTTSPSVEDRWLTEAIVHGGKLLGVEVHDHLIVTREAITSLAAEGLMPRDDDVPSLRAGDWH